MSNRAIMSDKIMGAMMIQSEGIAREYLRAKKLEYAKTLSADLLKTVSEISARTMGAYLAAYSGHRASEPST